MSNTWDIKQDITKRCLEDGLRLTSFIRKNVLQNTKYPHDQKEFRPTSDLLDKLLMLSNFMYGN